MNFFLRNKKKLNMEGKEFVLTEKSAYKFFSSMEALDNKDLLEFLKIALNDDLELISKLISIKNINLIAEEFLKLHIDTKENEEKQTGDILKSLIKILIAYAEKFNTDPLTLSKKYTFRQLQTFGKVLLEGQEENCDYMETVNEFGTKIRKYKPQVVSRNDW